MVERSDLEIDDRGRLGWIADLEDIATAVRRLHQAVLVAFTGQRLDAAVDTVEAASQSPYTSGGTFGAVVLSAPVAACSPPTLIISGPGKRGSHNSRH